MNRMTVDLGEMTLPELIELLHRVADEIQLRLMEQAGHVAEDRCVCCGEIVPEGRYVCPKCEIGEVKKKEN